MEKNNLHVLVVTTWYPNGIDRLIGVYHKLFCKALADTGKVKVNMLYVDRQGLSGLPSYIRMKKYYEDQNEGYVTYGKRMLDISKFSFDAQMKSYTNNLRVLCKRYIKLHGKPDVIHAQVTVPAGYAACVVGEELGIPVMVTEHASYFERFFTGANEKYGKLVAQKARMTCVGKYMTESLSKHSTSEAAVLPNIVDTSKFSGKRNRVSEGFRLVSVSALRPGKYFDDAIRAVKILKDSGSIGDLSYTIIGDGQEEQLYRNTVRELGLEDTVIFAGRKTAEEIAVILSDSDALVVASDIETFCIPAVEAVAAGVPVVCTRCKGPEGFLNSDCAEFCNIHDPEDMADAVRRLYERYDSLDEMKIRAVAKQFDSSAVAELAISMYESLLK